MARFISLKDKGRNYLDTLTGETVSKRQRDKALRGNISNELAAKMNRQTNLELAVSRPARGRASLLKKSETERALIAAARIEDEARKAELLKKEREEKFIQRTLARKAEKKVKFRHLTNRILKPGSKGARVNFNTYEEYLILAKEAKALGTVIAYGLGMVGFDENSGKDLGITVFSLMSPNMKPITRPVFEETFLEERENRMYFVFQHYFMHVAFKKEFYEKVLADAKAKAKNAPPNRRPRTSKKRKAARK